MLSVAQTALTLMLRLSTPINKAVHEFFERAWQQKNKDGSWDFLTHGGCTLHIDFEQHIASRLQIFANLLSRLSVPIAVNFGVFQEFVVGDHALKGFLGDKMIGIPFAFAGPWGSCGDGGDDVEIHALLLEGCYDGIFSSP